MSSHNKIQIGLCDEYKASMYMTQTEIAEVIGITRTRVAQIERSALLKLRIGLATRGYTEREIFGK